MDFTWVTYNVNWSRRPGLVASALGKIVAETGADVLLLQETKHVHVADVAPQGYDTFQRLGHGADDANAALGWREGFDSLDTGLDLGVTPQGHRMLTRHLTWSDLRMGTTTVRSVSIHRPPRRFNDLWDDFDDALAAFINASPHPVVVGGDFNDRTMADLAARTSTVWHHRGIDGFLVSKSLRVNKIWRATRRSSDHPPVAITIDVPQHQERSGMKFVSREEWGATRKRPTRSTHPIGSTRGITAHWEGPGMGGFDHSRCARKVRTIERFHEVNRGWSGIAYNAIVCPHGYVFEGRGPGVKSAANGYTSVNEDWYAVCYLGGKGDSFTEEGKRGFLDAFDWLTREGDAGPARNGHRDHKPTSCPGDEIYAWVHSGCPTDTPHEEDDDMPSPEQIASAVWNAEVADYDGPEKINRRARVMLSQAHNRAGDARANAHAALAQANRNRDAIEALGKALDSVAPGVAQEVLDALGERIEVTLSVDPQE